MKEKVIGAAQWLAAAVLILLGVAGFAGGENLMALWCVAGVLLVPPVWKPLLLFVQNRWILLAVCAVLLGAGVHGMNKRLELSNPPESGTALAQQVEELNGREGKLLQWLDEQIYVECQVPEQEELDRWKNFSAEKFDAVWKIALNPCVTEWDMASLSSRTKQLGVASEIYARIRGEENLPENVRTAIADIQMCWEEASQLEQQYPFDIRSAAESMMTQTLYITQRLDETYDENLLGALQKELNSYVPEEDSFWVAYDAQYIGGTAYPGETLWILYADQRDYFPQAGAHNLSCVNTGKTIQIERNGGFVSEVPVYQIIENGEQFQLDAQLYGTDRDWIALSVNELVWYLEQQNYPELPTAEQVPDQGIGGIYRDGAVEIVVSPYMGTQYLFGEISIRDLQTGAEILPAQGYTRLTDGIYLAQAPGADYRFGIREENGQIRLHYYVNEEYAGAVPFAEAIGY